MRPDKLHYKRVIDSQAKDIGEVYDIECEVADWKVTHLCVRLSDRAIEALGFVKPRLLGRVIVDIPVNAVKVVNDVVYLWKSLEEIESLVLEHQ
jgi:sporulation protein YlmC with PRC-barrel domain